MSAVTLHRIDPSRNVRRYYRLDVQPDLFGWWVFIREWGRIGAWCKSREASFATLVEAETALERQRRGKERRGYVDVKPCLTAASRVVHAGAAVEGSGS